MFEIHVIAPVQVAIAIVGLVAVWLRRRES